MSSADRFTDDAFEKVEPSEDKPEPDKKIS